MYVCLFDIDGTLLLSGGAGKAAMEAALTGTFGVSLRSHDVQFSGRTDVAILRDLLHFHALEGSLDNRQRFQEAYLQRLPASLAKHRGQVLPGIQALLEHLSKLPNVALGLLTGNVREGARFKLSHYGLWQHFAFGGFGDDLLDRNDVALRALATAREYLRSQVELERFWVIGDTPLDVSCARFIGARAVAVATGWHSLAELADTQPDLLLGDLSDPTPLLSLVNDE